MKSSKYEAIWWEEKAKKNALNLFSKASQEVPAYKKFLQDHQVNPKAVKTFSDFEKIPSTNKENYIKKYRFQDRIWRGSIQKSTLISSSSGTTGKPFYWPNAKEDIEQGVAIHQEIFDYLEVERKKTLLVICFSMGTWIAGIYTLLCTYFVKKNIPHAIVTPGFDKKASLQALQDISPHFEQTVIAGYPTFVKDVIESTSIKQKPALKYIFAGEGFSEKWRDLVTEKNEKDMYIDAVSILGSADAAIMGFETPFTIFTRREASRDSNLTKHIFNNDTLPSLFAYLPENRLFETQKSNLLLTANKNHPLIRFETGDRGGVLSPLHVRNKIKNFSKYNIISRNWKNKNIHQHLPMVYTFGREKFTITLFAANIYPENIKDALIQKDLQKTVTSNYFAETQYDNNQDSHLHIHIELTEQTKPSNALEERICKAVTESIKKSNSEYAKILQEYGKKAVPKISLYNYADQKLFPKKIVRKTS